jgi:pimeloyl-ACP methyl ester carboxylesterase
MPVVLVHGNPETPAVWTPLVEAWGRDDVVCLNLPGFGCDRPAGFGATKEEYLAWLVGELEAMGEPVHLVGHDWGGGLVGRLAMVRPDLVATWASDALGLFHPRYVWHEAAQVWQTPGEGEALIAAMLDIPLAERSAGFAALGIPEPTATQLAEAADAVMGECILALYRSATQPAMAEWGADAAMAAVRPGLFLHATEDPYVGKGRGVLDTAASMGAEVAELEGLGHWWMLEDPVRSAGVLGAWVAAH